MSDMEYVGWILDINIISGCKRPQTVPVMGQSATENISDHFEIDHALGHDFWPTK